jgi:hypothetical protein
VFLHLLTLSLAEYGTPEESIQGKRPLDKLSTRIISAQHILNITLISLNLDTSDVKICQARSKPDNTTSNLDFPATFAILRVLPSMSLRTFRLKIRKLMGSTISAGDIELWLRMGDGTLVQMGGQDDQDLAWWGLDNDSEVLFNVNIDH